MHRSTEAINADFLQKELEAANSGPISNEAPGPVVGQPTNEPSFMDRIKERVKSLTGSEAPTEKVASPTGRHSLKTCPCESCQKKRIALASQWGIAVNSEVPEEAGEVFNAEILGKIILSFHSYRFISLKSTDPDIAEAWKVTEETQEACGKMGEAILRKYLAAADFRYKQEIILSLFLASDIGIRLMHEKKLQLIKAEK